MFYKLFSLLKVKSIYVYTAVFDCQDFNEPAWLLNLSFLKNCTCMIIFFILNDHENVLTMVLICVYVHAQIFENDAFFPFQFVMLIIQ